MAIEGLSDRPWILLPGTLCTSAMFDPFLDALGVAKANRRYIELDRPSVADYRGAFEIVTADTVVCGFSLGAIVAAHAADRMTPYSLVLFGLNPFADDPNKAQGRRALFDDVKRMGGAAALQGRGPDVYGPTPDQTRNAIFLMADQAAHLIEVQTQLALWRPGALPALAQSTAPVLCLTGSHDNAAPSAQGRAAAQSTPGGQFCELDGLGHFALIEDPDACAKAARSLHEARHDAV